jgi:hypothetical protein
LLVFSHTQAFRRLCFRLNWAQEQQQQQQQYPPTTTNNAVLKVRKPFGIKTPNSPLYSKRKLIDVFLSFSFAVEDRFDGMRW